MTSSTNVKFSEAILYFFVNIIITFKSNRRMCIIVLSFFCFYLIYEGYVNGMIIYSIIIIQ